MQPSNNYFFHLVVILAAAVVLYFVFESRINKNNANSSLISPTAHYTGYTWVKNGLSDPRLATEKGKYLFYLLEPVMKLRKYFDGPTLEDMLLARHQLLDMKLEQAIESGKVTQVVEVAAGLSPRGLRFAQRYGKKIKYIEADLPEMVALKKSLISFDPLNLNHKIVAIDALQTNDSSIDSIMMIVQEFNRSQGTIIITEGLVNYFSKENLITMWEKFATALSIFKNGMYISDIHLSSHAEDTSAQMFKLMLSTFVRRTVHNHFKTISEVESVLLSSGFKFSYAIEDPITWSETYSFCRTAGARRVSIVDAKTSY